tara:strand:+ start:83 stop:286 length:204 start_codon:yes stop_codon:yes gene_type:complete
MGRSSKIARMGMPSFEKNKKLHKNATSGTTTNFQGPSHKGRAVEKKKDAAATAASAAVKSKHKPKKM